MSTHAKFLIPLLVSILLISGCGSGGSGPNSPSTSPSPIDRTAPVVALAGPATVNHVQGSIYIDQGASATHTSIAREHQQRPLSACTRRTGRTAHSRPPLTRSGVPAASSNSAGLPDSIISCRPSASFQPCLRFTSAVERPSLSLQLLRACCGRDLSS